VEPREAALTILREESAPIHWTKVQDLALRRGYLDPFTQSDVRKQVLKALAELAREGVIRKRATGVYEFVT
jgi:hypothetical protein